MEGSFAACNAFGDYETGVFSKNQDRYSSTSGVDNNAVKFLFSAKNGDATYDSDVLQPKALQVLCCIKF